MAKVVVVVDIQDRTAAELIRDVGAIEDLGQGPKPDGWDILALIWGGDLEHLVATPVVDIITDDLEVPAQAPRTGPCPCECTRGGFCGGCGHAGCGRR